MKNTQKVISKMKKLCVSMSQNCTFSQLTTLGCGGKIELTIFPDNVTKLTNAVRYLQKCNIPFCIVGCGSNLLAGDKDYAGVVVCTKRMQNFTQKGCFFTADCGVFTTKIAQACIKQGLTNGEFLGCLPATIGGATVCNAGCFGQSMDKIVHCVTVLQNGKKRTFYNNDCNFSHRNSIFKGQNYLLLQVVLKFEQSTPQTVAHKIHSFKIKKAQTQPLGSKSAGCVLYHPTIAVSKLVDQAGLKGYTVGRAKVSKKHAGFVVNIDKATAKDIYLLVRQLQCILHVKYGVNAQIELCLVNFEV